jgi:hypothetical protein
MDELIEANMGIFFLHSLNVQAVIFATHFENVSMKFRAN